jgi:hypothetical protein
MVERSPDKTRVRNLFLIADGGTWAFQAWDHWWWIVGQAPVFILH